MLHGTVVPDRACFHTLFYIDNTLMRVHLALTFYNSCYTLPYPVIR